MTSNKTIKTLFGPKGDNRGKPGNVMPTKNIRFYGILYS